MFKQFLKHEPLFFWENGNLPETWNTHDSKSFWSISNIYISIIKISLRWIIWAWQPCKQSLCLPGRQCTFNMIFVFPNKYRCLMRPGGRMLLGVERGVEDQVLFNMHRSYGPHQMPHLLANWEQVYQEPGYEGMVIEKEFELNTRQ